uniref:Uncharacterized protein n=1 Tax=Eimeria tenella TaxID=5802 RepID=H9B917_EIMTE|nr:hypothetical protein [Eimeria tenella]
MFFSGFPFGEDLPGHGRPRGPPHAALLLRCSCCGAPAVVHWSPICVV